MKSEVFQQLFEHGTAGGVDGEVNLLPFRMLRRKGADFMLLPLDNGLAVKALTLYAPQNPVARIATALLRYSLKLGLPVPLKPVELEVRRSSPLIEFFTDALNLSGLGATDFAIIAGNPKDAARRYVFLLFDTLHRPALVVKVGLGPEGAATVANEYRFLENSASADGVIPEPQGHREGEEFAAFALRYQPGWAPQDYEDERIASCLGNWRLPGPRRPICELPLWGRLTEACDGLDGFEELAEAIRDHEVSPVIYHGDFAPWNIKVRPGDGSWVVLDWERGEPEGLPGWDWFHYVVQTGVLVEGLDEKSLRAKLIHIMESKPFCSYAALTGIEPIKLEIALLYLLYSIHVLGQAGGGECLISLYEHLRNERSTGIGRRRRDFHTFWAAREQGEPWLKTQLVQRAGACVARIGYQNRLPALALTAIAFAITCAGTWLVLRSGAGNLASSLGLLGALLLGSSVAAAEPMLARATGTVTRRRFAIDRLAGAAAFAVVVSMLVYWAGAGQSWWLPASWRPAVFALAIGAGVTLSVLRVYGDLKRGLAVRQRRESGRISARLRPWLNRCTDGVLLIFLLSAAWFFGVFWDFLALYGLLLLASAVVEWIGLRAWLRGPQAGSGPLGRIFNSSRRSLVRLWRRFLFIKVFLTRKQAQLFGVGSRWVRPGARRTPAPKVVDVVYLWKDESDAAWVERREEFLERIGQGRGYNRVDMGSRATETSLDRLKYSMRSVDNYFESLGRIFLVTDGQRPAWLRDDDPRVVLVDLDEIFSDPAYLPSYNSQAIESYFYNIPGLSEFFVYLNDDFFLNGPVSAGDFFTRDGLIRVRLGRAVAARGVPSVDEEGDTSAQKNANLVLDRHFKKEPRLTVMHRPYAHRKSLMARAAEEFPEEFHLTRRSHFRSIEMFALHSYLIPYWAYYTGEAELVPPQLFRKDMFYWSNDPRHNQDVIDRIRETDPISFCIQAELSTHLTEKSVESYRQAMDSVFPNKSSFEI